uniref:TFIIS-type domain-containing protein n=1 Tax=Trypanosoma congolense (strain IL3000) TaxID=1068625 RepID=G0V1U4_TRYCI|nr:hypothetical protein, unlikely [Trypanosoma congolense IL3000]
MIPETKMFALGSRCCVVCGHWVPLRSKDKPTIAGKCALCGYALPIEPPIIVEEAHMNTAAAVLFTSEEIKMVQESVRQHLGNASSCDAFRTHTDNRVEEEVYCEKCAAHRRCKMFARQIRSADEGQTIFYQCTKCNSEWQLNS